MEERSDQALAAEVARGDAAALRTLYDRHEVQAFNLVLRMTRDRQAAEDVLQETFTRVWLMARTYDPGRGSFKGWLFAIAVNLARDALRRKRHGVQHVEVEDAEAFPSTSDGPDVELARNEEARRVADAVGRLPPHFREVVILKIYQQLKFTEIAEITGAPVGTLKARLHRAVAALREALGSAS
jgi:RNA polymerase sigma-70 factor (ECF subfamily)